MHGSALGLLIPFKDDGVGGGDTASAVVLGLEVLPCLGPVMRGKDSAWHVLAEKDARVQLSGHIALVVLDLQHDGARRRRGFDKVRFVIREGVGGAVVDQNLMAVGVEDQASTGLRCGGSEEICRRSWSLAGREEPCKSWKLELRKLEEPWEASMAMSSETSRPGT
jgi:hypothetical protein